MNDADAPHSRYSFYGYVIGLRRHHVLADWNTFALDIVLLCIHLVLWDSHAFNRVEPVRGCDCDQQRYEGCHAADDARELQQTTFTQNLVHGANRELLDCAMCSALPPLALLSSRAKSINSRTQNRSARFRYLLGCTRHGRECQASLPLAKSVPAVALTQTSVWLSSDHHHKCTYRNTTLQFFPTRLRFIPTVVDPVIGLRKRRTSRLLAAVSLLWASPRLDYYDATRRFVYHDNRINQTAHHRLKWPIRFRFVKGLRRRRPTAHFVSELPRVQFHSETVSRNCPCPFRSIRRESVPKSASFLLSYCRFSSAS